MFYRIAAAVLRFYYKIFFLYKSYGTENIPKDGGFLLCPNHQSFNDPPLVAAVIKRRLTFLAKEELFKKGIADSFLKSVGAVPIDRKNGSLKAMRVCMNLLKDGHALMLFPEGTRFCKHLCDVKPGAIMFAIKSRVPIIPVGISNMKLFGKTKVRFGKPIYYSDYYERKVTGEEYKHLTEKLMFEIFSLVDDKCCYYNEIEECMKNVD